MAKHDLLKQCNFQIIIPNRPNLEFFVQEVPIPGFQLGEMQMSHWTQNEARPGDNISWDRLQLTVVCDEDLQAYKDVYNHIILEKDPENGYLEISRSVFDAKLMLTTNKSNIQHVITFKYAWIVSVGELQLTTTSTEDEQITFTVEVAYTYFEFER